MLSMLKSGGRIHLALELMELYLKAIECISEERAHTTHSIPILQSHSPDFFHDRTADSKKTICPNSAIWQMLCYMKDRINFKLKSLNGL